MATHTKTIGTTGRDYSTLQAWEDDLDDGTNAANNTTGYVAGEDAVGEVYADSTFTGSLVLTGGDVVGLNSVTLTVPVAERHDGTAGTGAKMTAGINIQEAGGDEFVVEWIEIDLGGSGGPAISTNSSAFTKVPSIRNMLVHDQSGGNSFVGFTQADARDCQVLNSIFYDNVRNTSFVVYGLALDSDRPDGGCFNNTVYNVANTGSGDAYGISINTDSANARARNNISMGTTSSTGTPKDFNFGGSTNLTSSNNLSGDDTADDGGGSNHQISKTIADQFVSTVGGSEDLHLKAGSDAIGNGFDLGTTPSGVEIDINGRDRDAEGDVWDIGSHQTFSVAAFQAAWGSNATTIAGVASGQ
jgi:hypothetical protein